MRYHLVNSLIMFQYTCLIFIKLNHYLSILISQENNSKNRTQYFGSLKENPPSGQIEYLIQH